MLRLVQLLLYLIGSFAVSPGDLGVSTDPLGFGGPASPPPSDQGGGIDPLG